MMAPASISSETCKDNSSSTVELMLLFSPSGPNPRSASDASLIQPAVSVSDPLISSWVNESFFSPSPQVKTGGAFSGMAA